jgi:hypothetical protein
MSKQIAALLITSSVLATLSLNVLGGDSPQNEAAATQSRRSAAAYTQDGRLKFPDSYREWIYLSSGLDMSYRERGEMAGHSMFDNVFVDREAYREFLKTGTWPDGTLLVMEVRGATQKGSINKTGKFQSGEPMGVEVHAKDTQRFAGGWAFFAFGGTEPVAQIPSAADCYTCHRDHGVVDTTFVQFYPTLLKIANQHGTVKSER